ncbi:MAG: hypothetical protein MK212_10825 [Saprospiraceae bacterium]|nr:hypothetical protein [Saprospiraceae bacterium]
MKKIFLCALILSCSFVALQAQRLPNVPQQTEILEYYGAKRKWLGDNIYEIEIKLKIKGNWSIYSNQIENSGPVPISFSVKDPLLEPIGDLVEEGNTVIDEMDPIFKQKLKKYKNLITLRQKIRIKRKENNSLSIPVIRISKYTGYLKYQACNHNKCTPPLGIDLKF